MATLYIMRHGETDLNVEHRMQGRQDLPLNANGLRQAEEHRDRLRAAGIRFDDVFSSPLQRSVRTACIVADREESGIRIDPRLIEIDYGPFEGLTYHELDAQMVEFFHDPVHHLPPAGVEHIQDLIDRASAFLEELRCAPEREEHILVSTHGVVMRAMMAYFSNMTWDDIWKIMIGNCETYVVELTGNRFGQPRIWDTAEGSGLRHRESPFETRSTGP